MSEAIVVFNAGSTSLKFGAYAVDETTSLHLLCLGRIDSMQGDPHFVVKDAGGNVVEVHCTLDTDTRHGMPGAERKVKGTIHWVSAKHAAAAEVRLYERLFTVADPDDTSDGKTYAEHLNAASKRVVQGWLEPSLADWTPEAAVQFERLGYFVADRHDHASGKPVFNRTVTLRDSYAVK